MPSVSTSTATPVKRNCPPGYGRSLLAHDQQTAAPPRRDRYTAYGGGGNSDLSAPHPHRRGALPPADRPSDSLLHAGAGLAERDVRDGLEMAERLQGVAAVVAAHAAFADATERQSRHEQLHHRLAPGDAAGGRLVHQARLGVLGRGEGVQREWLVAFVDEGDGGIEVFDFDDGEDRAEDLLLHDR